ncbi:transmembrane protein 260-like [Gigantopelta aegis]|uniref:transmembrane protein 260-like n=1 Tax=Gigantopelta aegis TaxID=1735272 RepID=UPI001B888ABD|nr:transmembrane protein 260-like [Gigantopelta aegis]
MMSTKRDVGISVGIGFITMAVYVNTLYPSLPGGDSGELILAAHELGVAHPPGYPVFTLLAHVAMVIVPFGNIAWRVNLLSAMFGSVSAATIYQTSAKLTGSVAAGILASGLFAFSRLTWVWSITAEVFSLNNLFVSLLMLLAVCLEQTKSVKASSQIALLGSFTCGLCLCNQHTSVIYIACLVPWVFSMLYKSQTLTWTLFIKLCLCFVAGLTPYVYIPLSAHANVARWTWGDQRTFPGFVTHLLREEYGTFQLLKDHSGQTLLENIRKYVDHVRAEYSILILPLMVFTVPSVCKRLVSGHHRSVGVFSVMFLVYVVFFAWRANLDVKNPLLLGVVERFWMQSDLVLVILLAVAFGHLVCLVSTYIPLDHLKLDVILSVAVVAFQIQRNYALCDQTGNLVIEDFANSVLHSLPKDSMLLTEGDLSATSLRYFQLCEHTRPDLAIFDQQILTYEWSLAMTRTFHSKIVFPGDVFHLHNGKMPDGKVSFNFKCLLDVNYEKPIFTCIGVQVQDPSWKNYYDLWPYGTCHQIIKKDSNFNVKEWVQQTKDISKDWNYDFYGYKCQIQ